MVALDRVPTPSATPSGCQPGRVAGLLGPTPGQFQPPFDVSKRSQRPPAELSTSWSCSANRRNGSVQYQVRIPLGSQFLNHSADAVPGVVLVGELLRSRSPVGFGWTPGRRRLTRDRIPGQARGSRRLRCARAGEHGRHRRRRRSRIAGRVEGRPAQAPLSL